MDVQRALRLEYLTVTWNAAEAAIAIAAGGLAGSIALIGFGLDSLIEVSSGVVLLWRLHCDADVHRREAVEARALKLVGMSLLALAVYVVFDAGQSLLSREVPEASFIGIALAIVSWIVMPLLAGAKRRMAVRIGSRALAADSRQTDICAYLSAILLVGLGLNAAFGWWWADPVGALAMVPFILWESKEAFAGKRCCDEEQSETHK
jgi:divalent metal cation (Fe/Co/Zn/Cd) transporter